MFFRYNIILFVLCFCYTAIQAQQPVIDDFSDGDFTQNPVWQGDAALWVVDNRVLQSNGPQVTPSSIYLSTPSTFYQNCQWEFFVNPRLATSSGNYMDVAIMSNTSTISDTYNGYFVRVGGTPDEVSLFRRDGSVISKIIDGTDGLIAGSSNNPTKIKVIKDANGIFELFADPSGVGAVYLSQGTANDLTYNSSVAFGVKVYYSASNFNRYSFDDLYIGPIIYDTDPPKLEQISVLNTQTLVLTFSEAVELASAQNIINYAVNKGIGQPATAVRDAQNASVVLLSLANNLVSGTQYQISLSNVMDLSGNLLPFTQKSFFYYVPKYGDVQVNELIADPSPTLGLPDFEFIELYNNAAFPINLNQWKIADNTSSSILGDFELQPDSFLILCSPTAEPFLRSFGTTLAVNIASTFLNNGGDKIEVINANNEVIHSVSYTDQWYGDVAKKDGGWSLEQINPNFPCKNTRKNWSASINTAGGTPGRRNSIYSNIPDTQAPQIAQIQSSDGIKVRIVFSKPMDSLALMNATISINSGAYAILSRKLLGSDDTLELTVSPALTPNSFQTYFFQIDPVRDCWGNLLSSVTYNFYYSPAVSPNPNDIIITEIMTSESPSRGLPEYEYIEIYNRSNNFIDLAGCGLHYNNTRINLPSAVVAPYDYIILSGSLGFPFLSAYGNAVGVTSFPSMAASGAALTLTNPNGVILYRLEYSDSWHDDGFKKSGGWSLELGDTSTLCAGTGAWFSSRDSSGGTPGRENSVKTKYTENNELTIGKVYPINNSTLRLPLNKQINSGDLLNITVQCDGLEPLDSIAFDDLSRKNIHLKFANPMQAGETYTLKVSNLKDCFSGDFAKAQEAKVALPSEVKQKLIINEVLFNPEVDADDYIEIYHVGDAPTDLKNHYMANADNNGLIKDLRMIATEGLIMFPGDYYVFTVNPESVFKHYFVAQPMNIFRTGSLPTYSNESGTVIFLDSNGLEYDRLYYEEQFHFVMLNEKKGVALERIDPKKPTQDKNNWTSASSTAKFGTPTDKNSQYRSIGQPDNAVKIDPITFSPDGDGFEDLLRIQFNFSKPGYMANLRIFDKIGNQVKHLINNELLSSSGFYAWDGINDEGVKAPVGVYVLWFEIFDTNGDVQRYKLPFVLASSF